MTCQSNKIVDGKNCLVCHASVLQCKAFQLSIYVTIIDNNKLIFIMLEHQDHILIWLHDIHGRADPGLALRIFNNAILCYSCRFILSNLE